MAGIDLKLKSGSFAGAIFPVDLDISYTPDSVDAATSVIGSAFLFYDESVVEVVPGSITTGGVHAPGTGVISWPSVTVSDNGAWKKVSAQFQWTDYREDDTWFNGAFNSRETGMVNAPALIVARPSAPRGTKLKSSS